MRFTKMHGLGNDFIVIEAVEKEYFPTPNDARRLCNRRTGIGADGLLLALPSQKADLRMRLLNSDGSTAEMCGNGIRCFAKFAYERGLAGSNPMRIETPAGIKLAELTVKGGRVTAIRVDMGEPLFDKKDIPMKGEGICRLETIEALGRSFTISAVNTGVPHIAVFGEVTEEDIRKCCRRAPHLQSSRLPLPGKGLRQDAGLRHRKLRRRGMCKYGGLYGAQC